ncbi:MAG: 50S ribosomal protein L10 [archaeon]
MKRENPIPEYKKKTVNELAELVKNKKTILIASIKNIPSSQFQEIVKKLRGKAIVKVPKRNLMFRALDSSADEAVKKLGKEGKSLPHLSQLSQMKEQIGDSTAVLFSDLDSFELAGELANSVSPAKAKPGQEAPEDIEVDAGPTDLVPGPAISELGALGIQIQIEKGKIHIKEPKVIAKKGAKISSGAAALMSKLDIKPFKIGFIPLSAFDTQEGKLYLDIKIDREGTLNDLKYAYSRALPFAIEIGYTSEDTIKFLIGKANAHANKVNRIMTGEPELIVEETPKGEVPQQEIKEDKKEEPKADAGAGLASLFG